MGIEVTYRRITRAEFEILQADPKKAEEFVCAVLPGFNLDDLIAMGDNPEVMLERGSDILAGSPGIPAHSSRGGKERSSMASRRGHLEIAHQSVYNLE